jgi:hypothetical protein
MTFISVITIGKHQNCFFSRSCIRTFCIKREKRCLQGQGPDLGDKGNYIGTKCDQTTSLALHQSSILRRTESARADGARDKPLKASKLSQGGNKTLFRLFFTSILPSFSKENISGQCPSYHAIVNS